MIEASCTSRSTSCAVSAAMITSLLTRLRLASRRSSPSSRSSSCARPAPGARRDRPAPQQARGGDRRTALAQRLGASFREVALRLVTSARVRGSDPDRTRPDRLAREGRDHADDRHLERPAGAVPARRCLEQPQRGLVERERRPVFLEHRRARVGLVALPDRRRREGADALSVLRRRGGGSSTGFCSRRCSCLSWS